MSATTTAVNPSGSVYASGAFYERLWRMSGINFIACAVLAYFVYGVQPQIGAPADTLVGFYDGNRTRILIAAVIAGMAILNLMWFVAALRSVLAEAQRDGWGGAATIASATFGALALLALGVVSVLALSVTRSENLALAGGLNDFAWASLVLSSFPRAMLIMSGSFGLWRARMISNGAFALCVAAIVLVLLGGTTWMSDGVWAPDGVYSRAASPLIGIVWLLAVSRVLLRAAPTRTGW